MLRFIGRSIRGNSDDLPRRMEESWPHSEVHEYSHRGLSSCHSDMTPSELQTIKYSRESLVPPQSVTSINSFNLDSLSSSARAAAHTIVSRLNGSQMAQMAQVAAMAHKWLNWRILISHLTTFTLSPFLLSYFPTFTLSYYDRRSPPLSAFQPFPPFPISFCVFLCLFVAKTNLNRRSSAQESGH